MVCKKGVSGGQKGALLTTGGHPGMGHPFCQKSGQSATQRRNRLLTALAEGFSTGRRKLIIEHVNGHVRRVQPPKSVVTAEISFYRHAKGERAAITPWVYPLLTIHVFTL